MSDDETRKLILARRAKFIAAAVASVGIAACKATGSEPQPCLTVQPTELDASQPPTDPSGTGTQADPTPPHPCLSPMPPDPQPPVEDAGPRPCLKVAAPPQPPKPNPQPCLSVAPKPTK